MKYIVSRTAGLWQTLPPLVAFKLNAQGPLHAASEVEKLIRSEVKPPTDFTSSPNGIRETFETHLVVQKDEAGSDPEIYRVRHIIEILKIG